MHPDKYILKHRIAPGRRHYERVDTRQAVWVYWSYEKLEGYCASPGSELGRSVCRDTGSAARGSDAQA
jgi:hypothetical protein